MSKEIQGTELH